MKFVSYFNKKKLLLLGYKASINTSLVDPGEESRSSSVHGTEALKINIILRFIMKNINEIS
jgi:hypothetical protein